jgi:hypothetical protein
MFDAATGAYEGTLDTSGKAGLNGPRGLIFGEGHDLLAINQNVGTTLGGEVFRYDGKTGEFLNKVVADTDPHGPYDPRGMVRGPHHSLFIGDLGDLGNLDGTGRPGRLAQFDEKTGAWIRDLSPTVPFTTGNGPRGVVIGPDGNLCVAVRNFSTLGGEVMRFNPATGAFLGDFVVSDATNDLNRHRSRSGRPAARLRPGALVRSRRQVVRANHRQRPGYRGGAAVRCEHRHVRCVHAAECAGRPLGMPWYLTFGDTDPATLAFSPGPRTGGGASPTTAPTPSLATSALDLAPLASSLLRMEPQTFPATPLPGPTTLPIGPGKQSAVQAASATGPALHPGAADVVFAGSDSAAADDSGWLMASLSPRRWDAL